MKKKKKQNKQQQQQQQQKSKVKWRKHFFTFILSPINHCLIQSHNGGPSHCASRTSLDFADLQCLSRY